MPAMTEGYRLSLSLLQSRLGYHFRDPLLLEKALAHASYAHESGLPFCNERLEYLGDAVLELIVSETLYRAYPDWDEGRLTQERSAIVCARSLAEWGRNLDVPSVLRLGRGLDLQGGRNSVALVADAVEALLGALYLDGGLEAVHLIVDRWLCIRGADEGEPTLDAKSRLQQFLQAQGRDLPLYRVVAEEGPPHERVFVIEVWGDEVLLGIGLGHSRKEGEFDAAGKALQKLMQPVALGGSS